MQKDRQTMVNNIRQKVLYDGNDKKIWLNFINSQYQSLTVLFILIIKYLIVMLKKNPH